MSLPDPSCPQSGTLKQLYRGLGAQPGHRLRFESGGWRGTNLLMDVTCGPAHYSEGTAGFSPPAASQHTTGPAGLSGVRAAPAAVVAAAAAEGAAAMAGAAVHAAAGLAAATPAPSALSSFLAGAAAAKALEVVTMLGECR